MEGLTQIIKTVLYEGGDFFVALFELVALVMIIIAGVRGLILYLKKDDNTALELLKGFSVGLSFLLGGEILKTVIITHDLTELMIVGGLVLIRVAISVLIHWEMEHEKKEHEMDIAVEKLLKQKENEAKTS